MLVNDTFVTELTLVMIKKCKLSDGYTFVRVITLWLAVTCKDFSPLYWSKRRDADIIVVIVMYLTVSNLNLLKFIYYTVFLNIDITQKVKNAHSTVKIHQLNLFSYR